jgi:hypothetical protein
MSQHSSFIPDFIMAQSPMGLRRLMFKTNAKAGAQFQYFDISNFIDAEGETKWIAWFFRDIKGIGDLDNGDSEQLPR